MFDEHDDYVADLAAHLWRGTIADVTTVTGRLREVRNPSLLAEVSPAGAATALRASLPSVAPEVIAATADALAESDATREAFERDRRAADVLADFATTWTGHVVDIVGRAHAAAQQAHVDATAAQTRSTAGHRSARQGRGTPRGSARRPRRTKSQLRAAEARVRELEESTAYEPGVPARDTAGAAAADVQRSLTPNSPSSPARPHPPPTAPVRESVNSPTCAKTWAGSPAASTTQVP